MLKKKGTHTTVGRAKPDNSAAMTNRREGEATQTISASDETNRIAALAYEFWTQRGCPKGSPEEDWFRAEEEIKRHARS